MDDYLKAILVFLPLAGFGVLAFWYPEKLAPEPKRGGSYEAEIKNLRFGGVLVFLFLTIVLGMVIASVLQRDRARSLASSATCSATVPVAR